MPGVAIPPASIDWNSSSTVMCPVLCKFTSVPKKLLKSIRSSSIICRIFTENNYIPLRISSRQPHFEPSERFHFPIGSNQQFSHFMFKPHRYDMKLMHWDGGVHFPVLIEIRSVSDQYPEQVQTKLQYYFATIFL